MKKTLFALTATAAIGLAAPAFAQSNYGYSNNDFGARIDRIEARVDAGVRTGEINRREAATLRQQLADLNRLEAQYIRNGLTAQERNDLQTRVRNLRQQVRTADAGRAWNDRDDVWADSDWIDRNNDGYDDRDFDRDGRWDDDTRSASNDRYDRYDRIDRNNDGYDDRDYDRDGRWDDDVRYTGQGGPYEEVENCETRTGLGGIVDRVFGTSSCTLRVGQRASDNLYSVPSQYRNQYRDSSTYRYRSDGRSIYQIDARTNTVTRVYPIN